MKSFKSKKKNVPSYRPYFLSPVVEASICFLGLKRSLDFGFHDLWVDTVVMPCSIGDLKDTGHCVTLMDNRDTPESRAGFSQLIRGTNRGLRAKKV